MPDLFNNPANDYIYPALSPCPGATDDTYLEFINEEIGIVAGNEILSKIDFSDFRIPVASYSTQIKIISEGEVVYVPGLTKGLTRRQLGFTMPTLVTTDEDLDSLFMQIDFSINYNQNFAQLDASIDASANYTLNVDIDDAINIVLAAKSINTTAVYDPSNFFFLGTVDGYDFDITNVTLSLIDTSENTSSPFAYTANASTYELVEDLTLEVPYAKYPNGAMQGMILKGTFPTAASDSDKWIYMNTVVSPFIVYEENSTVEYDSSIVTFLDPSTSLGTKPTIGTPVDASGTIDGSTLTSNIILDASISNSIISDSSIQNSIIYDTSISDSFLDYSEVVVTYGLNQPTFSGMEIWDSSITYTNLVDSSIYRGFILDSSVSNCTLYNVILSNSSSSTDNRIIHIDASVYNIIDTSTYYEQFSKKVDVGRNIVGTTTILSAAEYLDYINSNNLWIKVGELVAQVSSTDPGDTTKNLVGGFYVFNPHAFDVQIEYILFI